MGAPQLLETLLGDDADRVGDDAVQRHAANYAEAAQLLPAFPAAADLVRRVAENGAQVVLATSATSAELDRIRAVLDVEDSVAHIVAASDVEAAKRDPDVVEVALQRAGVTPDRAIFVGDMVWDVTAAARAGVECVGLLSGGIGAAELRDAGAIAVYDDPAALLAGLERSPLAATWRSLAS